MTLHEQYNHYNISLTELMKTSVLYIVSLTVKMAPEENPIYGLIGLVCTYIFDTCLK